MPWLQAINRAIRFNLCPGSPQKRANNPPPARQHTSEPFRSRTAQQMHEDCLCLVICMMCRDNSICTKLITPAIIASGWNICTHMPEAANLTAGGVVAHSNRTVHDKVTSALFDEEEAC